MSDDPPQQPTVAPIQILVRSEADRSGLQQMLGGTYALTFEQEVQPVGCYILTSRTLPEYVESLKMEKNRQSPTFCPVLLIQQATSRVSETFLASPEGVSLVDDILEAPVDPSILNRRVENLITRRYQSIALNQRFERAESWFHGVFDGIPDPAFVVDTSCTIQEANDAFCAFVGLPPTDLRERELTTLPVKIAAFDELEARLQSARENVTVGMGPFECDGETAMDHALFSTQTVEVDETTYVIGILSDVTELKQKTERLEKLASVLSHDLRNPVQVAQLHLPTLRETHPESDEQIEAIERAVSRIGDLTEELVTIARTGEELAFERLRVQESATVAWNHVETDTAELRIEEQACSFDGDSNRVLQLFENLFRNAIEHGGDDVTVWVGEVENGFYVEDSGSGIPLDERDDVFRLGYSTHENGNGLGLGIVTDITMAHGWQVSVEEGRTGGARFEIGGVEMNTDSTSQ